MENPYLVHIERHMARPNPLELGDLLLCLNLSKIIFPSRGASPLLETENSRPSHDISIFPPGEVCSHAFLSRFPNSSSARAAFMFTVVSRLPEMEYSNYSENLPNEDFRDGYVFFIGACKITGNRADKMVLTKELGYTGRYRAKIINPVKEPESLNTSRPWWKVLLGIN